LCIENQNSSIIQDQLFFSFSKKHAGIAFGQGRSYFTFSFSTSIGLSKTKKLFWQLFGFSISFTSIVGDALTSLF
jgi:hypothetical protein